MTQQTPSHVDSPPLFGHQKQPSWSYHSFLERKISQKSELPTGGGMRNTWYYGERKSKSLWLNFTRSSLWTTCLERNSKTFNWKGEVLHLLTLFWTQQSLEAMVIFLFWSFSLWYLFYNWKRFLQPTSLFKLCYINEILFPSQRKEGAKLFPYSYIKVKTNLYTRMQRYGNRHKKTIVLTAKLLTEKTTERKINHLTSVHPNLMLNTMNIQNSVGTV